MSRATVDLTALRHNLDLLRTLARGATVMPAVKANAYGHGAVPIARALQRWGVDWLAVSSAAEALELRAGGVTARILVMIPVRERIAELAEADVDLTVVDAESLATVARAGAARPARVHLKVDTGMGRLGQPPSTARELAARTARTAGVELAAVWTHFACGDSDPIATAEQLELFLDLLARLELDGTRPPLAHAANSAGVLAHPDSHLDLVRPGIALYGYSPGPLAADDRLEPVMTLSAPIIFVKRVAAGTPVSYGAQWRAPRPTTIATVQHGYADGYPRALGGRAGASLAGTRVPVVGRVCMDQLLVDVGESTPAVGDEVTLFGPDGPTAAELAALVDTIPYELLTAVGRRVERDYRE